jgi:uncharacterized repeat protein (TIGR01451 family)
MNMKWMARSRLVWKLIVIIALTILFCAAFTASVGAEDIYVGPGENYTTIQAAVNASGSGDTIIVRDGTYTENVRIYFKRLTIRSEHGAASTIVQSPNPNSDVFNVNAQYVTINGFTVSGAHSAAGIRLIGTNCHISDNTVKNNKFGIDLLGIMDTPFSSDNTITGNTLSSNDYGIWLKDFSWSTSLEDNTASSNTYYDFCADSMLLYSVINDLTIGSFYPTTISFTNPYNVKLKGVDTAPPEPPELMNIRKYVNATGGLSMKVHYKKGDLDNVDESSLKMWQYKDGTWTKVPGSGVNTTESYVFATITEGIFAPLGNFASLAVHKTASPTEAVPGTPITFTINLTNIGNCPLDPVKVVDTLPTGMSYDSSSPPANDTSGPIIWNNVGPLSPGNSIVLYLEAYIDKGANGTLNNTVYVEGKPPLYVSAEGYAEVMVLQPGITVSKSASPTSGASSTEVNFTIVVSNTGNCPLDPVKVVDTLPTGMSYRSSSPPANDTSGPIIWNNVGPLSPGNSTVLYLTAHIDSGASGMLNNTINVSGTPPHGDNVSAVGYAEVAVLRVDLEKTSSPRTVAPGGTVTYTINYTNCGGKDLIDVVITEHYPEGVTFISAFPAPDSGTNNRWTIGTLLAGASETITIQVKVPEPRDFSFSERGGVSGEGLVVVSKELSTEQAPYSLRNVVILECAELDPIRASAVTTVSGVQGTQTSLTEHGSGTYSSEQNINVHSKNRSIYFGKSTEAEYKPTFFDFGTFEVNFTTKWNQNLCSKNKLIHAAIRKRIDEATYLEDETISEVDKTSSAMRFDSSFNGSLYIGARTDGSAISETYFGEFNVSERIAIGKPPEPTPTPTPTWLPCPFPTNESECMCEP